MMKALKILTLAAVLTAFAAGCESFREDRKRSDDSDERPAAGRRERDGERRDRRRGKRRRDPSDDMFFGIGSGEKRQSFSHDALSPAEQRLLDEELRRQDADTREWRRQRGRVDSGRSKRREWVYGFKPLGGDK